MLGLPVLGAWASQRLKGVGGVKKMPPKDLGVSGLTEERWIYALLSTSRCLTSDL